MAGATQAKAGGAKAAPKPAPKPPPEIKELIAPSLQFPRICCDHPDCNHAPPGQPPSGDQAPTGWFRGLYVLLAKKPPPPTPAKPGEQAAVPEKPVFTLWATDGDGYLSPLAPPPPAPPAAAPPPKGEKPPEDPKAPQNPNTPGAVADAGKAVPLVPGEEYLLYLVLHPKKQVADDYLKQANGDGIKEHEDARATLLKKLVLNRERTGTTENKKKNTRTVVEEPVFRVKDAAFLTIPGGDLYGGFCLFGAPFQKKVFAKDSKGVEFSQTLPFCAMPNNYCPYVKKEVARLQAHLGAFRFPVGTQSNPYYSLRQDALTVSMKGPNDKEPQDYKIVFENPGVFDGLTYNAVLSFQRHAKEGRYVKLADGAAAYEELFAGPRFEPVLDRATGRPLVADSAGARRRSVRYLQLDPATDAPWDAAPVGSPEFTEEPDGVCTPETAVEIARWLGNGFRKAGHIMRAVFPAGVFPDGREVFKSKPGVSGGESEWMRDDAVASYIEWIDAARSMNAPQDILGTHVFRDIRDMVTGTAAGKIRNSIHKTGLAVDTSPFGGFLNKHPAYAPIVAVDPVTIGTKSKIRWRLYEDAAKGFNEATHGKARDRFAVAKGISHLTLFRTTVSPWQFDDIDPKGGHSLPAFPPGRFIDLTAVGAACGWQRISATSGLGAQKAAIIRIETTKVKKVLKTPLDQTSEALISIDQTAARNRRLDVMVERPAEQMTFVAPAGTVDTGVMRRWIFETQFAEFSPQPEVMLDAPLFAKPVNRKRLETMVHEQFSDAPFIVAFKTASGPPAYLEVENGRDVVLDSNVLFIVPSLGLLWIQSGDVVTTFKAGVSRTREWWHFQHDGLIGKGTADKTQWFTCLEKIGWTKEALRVIGYAEIDITPEPKK